MNIWQRLVRWLTGIWWKTPIKETPTFIYQDVYTGSEWVQAIKIIDGPYKDVVYYYQLVRFDPDTVKLSFTYVVQESPYDPVVMLSKDFRSYIGDILVTILLNEDGQGEYAEIREHDTQESNLS